MKLQRLDHVGIVVNDLPAAKAFFVDLGLEVQWESEFEDTRLDKIVGLKDVKTKTAMLALPDGQATLELIKFLRPADETGSQHPLANSPGIRHLAFVVDDLEAIVAQLKKNGVEIFSEIQTYEHAYKLCYVRGPEGIILELAEQIT